MTIGFCFFWLVLQSGYAVMSAIDTHMVVWAAPFVAILLPLAAIWIYGKIPQGLDQLISVCFPTLYVCKGETVT